MDPNVCIGELERIVQMDSSYVGPHGDPLAHAYGMASVLRDLASTDIQREKIAAAVAEIKSWYKSKHAGAENVSAARRDAFAAIANLKQAYGAR